MFKMPANERQPASERVWALESERKKCAKLFIAYDANEMHTTHVKTTMKERNENKNKSKQNKQKQMASKRISFIQNK